ncbi:GNAT family N-acetyltransferase [Thioalkalicoccus limnaeus]
MSRQDSRLRYRAVARLHAENIDQGFLPILGQDFLALLYQAIDESPDSALILAEEEGQVCGFIAGALDLKPVYRGLLRRWPALFLSLAPSLLIPTRLWRIIEIVRYSRKAGKGEAVESLPAAELLSVAVAPSCRGRGHAEALYIELARFFIERDQEAFKIVVGSELEHAHRFYRRMGAEPRAEIAVHGGTPSTAYVQQCADIHVSR